jgi:hypothetical protein
MSNHNRFLKNTGNVDVGTTKVGSSKLRSRSEVRDTRHSERDMCFGERRRERDNIGLISFGVFLVLVGIIYILTPNFSLSIERFFQDFQSVQVVEGIYLPAPIHGHSVFYFAVAEFALLFALSHIAFLIYEFGRGLSLKRKAETSSDIVFWFGASYIAYSLSIESLTWFQSWAFLVVVIGISIIVRAAIVAARKPTPFD